MEGFDLISTGVWSIIPPILALGLALITKEVYSSLAIGVFVGMVIYQSRSTAWASSRWWIRSPWCRR